MFVISTAQASPAFTFECELSIKIRIRTSNIQQCMIIYGNISLKCTAEHLQRSTIGNLCLIIGSSVDGHISTDYKQTSKINLNYKYENLSTRYDIPENGSFTATYSNDQTKYTIFDTKGNEICKFNVDYQKERPVHEYVYPNHVSYIEVLPNFTNRDRLIDSALGSLNIAIILIVLSISMI